MESKDQNDQEFLEYNCLRIVFQYSAATKALIGIKALAKDGETLRYYDVKPAPAQADRYCIQQEVRPTPLN